MPRTEAALVGSSQYDMQHELTTVVLKKADCLHGSHVGPDGLHPRLDIKRNTRIFTPPSSIPFRSHRAGNFNTQTARRKLPALTNKTERTIRLHSSTSIC